MWLAPACVLGSYPALLDSHGVLVFAVDGGVVCCRCAVIFGGVLVGDQFLRPAKCGLTPLLTPGDLYWVVRSLRFEV
ncbi:hypothetical protein SAMN05660282_01877 [Corynebacterium spheniscorum]|uniref:Uncharacterized protein n=1 Tax=Corynebacterium spheniscorum TaxID=185761 RepID=A0A1I2UGC7_9CORY|nr:hypothetical protein SAMN05660282_01877 [Corynebacterium spheniscorum]